MTNTFFFFHVKNVLKPPMIDASMILEQDWGKKIEFEGIDWRGKKVDDEIVSRRSSR